MIMKTMKLNLIERIINMDSAKLNDKMKFNFIENYLFKGKGFENEIFDLTDFDLADFICDWNLDWAIEN
jgi:hypothetical protein